MIDDEDEEPDFSDYNEDDWNDEAFRKEMEEEERRVRNLPVMQKADEIVRLTEAIVETIREEEDELHVRERMLSNACVLMPKIAGAEASDLYTLRMENAVLIKIHARELLAQTSLCKAEKLARPDDLQLLRNTLEEFRVLFVEWVTGFDKNNDIPDEWGIFQ